MQGSGISRRTYILWALGGVFSVLVVWQACVSILHVPPLFLPSPLRVATVLQELLLSGRLIDDIFQSTYRVVTGFVASVAIGVPFGLLIALHRRTEAFFEPMIAFLRYIPPSAFVPLFILWFGIGDLEKILVIFISTAPYLTVMVYDVVKAVRGEFIDAAQTLGASSRQILLHVIIPSAAPGIWDAMRIVIGISWSFVVLAEIVAATGGLGHLIITSQRFLQTPKVIGAMLVIGTLGLLTDYTFKWASRMFFPWVDRLHAHNR